MLTNPPEATQSDDRVLSPEEAGTLFIPADEQLLGRLRRKLNDVIRTTRRGSPVILDVGHIRSDLVKRLAGECQQCGWSAEILPVDSVARDHPLQTGSVLKLTKALTAGADYEIKP